MLIPMDTLGLALCGGGKTTGGLLNPDDHPGLWIGQVYDAQVDTSAIRVGESSANVS